MKNKNVKLKKDLDKMFSEQIKNYDWLVGDAYKKEKEDLANQTWPVWLLPEDFRSWYNHEQKRRKSSGMTELPDPPMDVIRKVFYT